MVLLSSLNTALTGLNSAMAALQTTGHNIANASTPGYSRQRVEMEANRALDYGRFEIGRGVNLKRIQRLVDESLEGRLRDSTATLGNLSVQSENLQRIEALLDALSDSDLGTHLDNLFEAIQDWANDPDDVSARNGVLEAARTAADSFNYVSGQVRRQREQVNDEIVVTVGEINRLTDEIADLNRQVLLQENGGVDVGTANDLRDRRGLLARQLSDLIGVTTVETTTGEINVLAGSAYLVFGQQSYALTTSQKVVDGLLFDTPVFASGSANLTAAGGKLAGLIETRDNLTREFQQGLDQLAHELAFQFNRIQSTGQGLERFSLLTSRDGIPVSTVPIAIEGSVTSASTANTLMDSSLVGAASPVGRQFIVLGGRNVLEKRTITDFDPVNGTLFFDGDMPAPLAIGDRYQITELEFPVVNGSFQYVVTNEITGSQQKFTITVDLDRIGADTTLADVAAQLNAALPGSATILPDGKLRLQSPTNDVRLAFANDTSGFVAAIGLNTFFDGTDGESIRVNPDLLIKPSLLSAAKSNADGDNSNALEFAALRSKGVVSGASLEDFYQGLVGTLGTRTSEMKNRAENQQLVLQQLENQRERTSGVNVDEEAVKMLEFQRAFQASARFLAVVDTLLDTLINGL
ncbi:MAG: flagellar hook-associated protein FlgK [Planctomycetes bacterium]|nr:flagellar hook-associated protein FlgK [Planctomycetota bacterium]